jgi:hypothetical protein
MNTSRAKCESAREVSGSAALQTDDERSKKTGINPIKTARNSGAVENFRE